jgi:hypothetical protein
MYDVVEQLGCLLRCGLYKGFVFDPLGENVNVDIDPVESSWCRLEWPNHIQSPTCKGLRSRNRL